MLFKPVVKPRYYNQLGSPQRRVIGGERFSDLNDKEERFEKIIEQLRKLIDDSVLDETEKQRVLKEAASVLTAADVTELIIGARSFRGKHLGEKLFGEPAWDILLQLHIAHYRNKAVSVTAAVTFGNTPASTGFRWLNMLEEEGLVERRSDPGDSRRQFVGLTQDGLLKIDAYIEGYSNWVATKATLRRL